MCVSRGFVFLADTTHIERDYTSWDEKNDDFLTFILYILPKDINQPTCESNNRKLWPPANFTSALLFSAVDCEYISAAFKGTVDPKMKKVSQDSVQGLFFVYVDTLEKDMLSLPACSRVLEEGKAPINIWNISKNSNTGNIKTDSLWHSV